MNVKRSEEMFIIGFVNGHFI